MCCLHETKQTERQRNRYHNLLESIFFCKKRDKMTSRRKGKQERAPAPLLVPVVLRMRRTNRKNNKPKHSLPEWPKDAAMSLGKVRL
jgi:hypothetical protein